MGVQVGNYNRGRRKVSAVVVGEIASSFDFDDNTPGSLIITDNQSDTTIYDPLTTLETPSSATPIFTAPYSRFYQINLTSTYTGISFTFGSGSSPDTDTYLARQSPFSHICELVIDGTPVTAPLSVGAVYGAGTSLCDFDITSGTATIPGDNQYNGFGLTKAVILLESGQTVSFRTVVTYTGFLGTQVNSLVGAVAVPANNYGTINGQVITGFAGSIANITDYTLTTSYSTSSSSPVTFSGDITFNIDYHFDINELDRE